jgi:hypothetical protein
VNPGLALIPVRPGSPTCPKIEGSTVRLQATDTAYRINKHKIQ